MRFPRSALICFIPTVFSACGGTSPEDAAAAYAAAYGAMSQAQASALGSALTLEQATRNIDFTYNCTGGGTIRLTGSYTPPAAENRTGGSTFDLSASFSGCAQGGITMNGSLAWSSVFSNATLTATIGGSVTFTGTISIPCEFDVSATVGVSAGAQVSGTVCGVDVADAGVAYSATR